MSKELIERLLDNRVTGFNLTVAAVEAADLIESLRQQLAAAQAENLRLRDGLTAVRDLIEESYGVAGLHLNGDVAPWSELLEGGKYEDWLVKFSEAME